MAPELCSVIFCRGKRPASNCFAPWFLFLNPRRLQPQHPTEHRSVEPPQCHASHVLQSTQSTQRKRGAFQKSRGSPGSSRRVLFHTACLDHQRGQQNQNALRAFEDAHPLLRNVGSSREELLRGATALLPSRNPIPKANSCEGCTDFDIADERVCLQ